MASFIQLYLPLSVIHLPPPSTQEINKKAQSLKSSIRGAPALDLAQGNTEGHGASAAGMLL